MTNKDNTKVSGFTLDWARSLVSLRQRRTGRSVAAILAIGVAATFTLGSGAAFADDNPAGPGSAFDAGAPADAPVTPPANDPAPSDGPADAPADVPSTPTAPSSPSAPETEAPAVGKPGTTPTAGGSSKPTGLVGIANDIKGVVAAPTGNNAAIRVRVAKDRNGTGDLAYSGLAGVKLALYNGDNSSIGALINQSWSTCTSDADGDCTFYVPNTATAQGQNANRDKRYFVKQLVAPGDVPAGFFANTQLGDGNSAVTYQFRTGTQLRSGSTYQSTDFMNAESSGIWQNSRNNPSLPTKCGLDVALVLDLSQSVSGSLPALKGAADTFVNSLAGTPSRVGVFSFSSTSPAAGGGQDASLTSVASPAGATAVKAKYAGWTVGGTTNWDDAFYDVANAAPHYDAVVVITDGNPTIDNGFNNGYFSNVEYGIFSANMVKAENSRVIAVGVGDGVNNADSGLNLAAISGQTKYTGANAATADYYQSADYAAAGTALRQFALGNCTGSVSVVKSVVPEGNTGENIAGAQVASGWTIGAATTAGASIQGSNSLDTDGSGAVNFPINFNGGVLSTTATITETLTGNYVNITQGAKNAVCVDKATNPATPLTVTNNGAAGSGSFKVEVPSNGVVSCSLYNRNVPKVDVTVQKNWVVNGVNYPNGLQPNNLSAQLTIPDPGSNTPVNRDWGVAYGGYDLAGTTRINEVMGDLNGCTLVGKKVTLVNGQAANVDLAQNFYEIALPTSHATATITNTLTCPVKLEVSKVDEKGDPLAGATFKFTPNPVTGVGSLSVTDNGVGDSEPADGVVVIDPALPGNYTVEETAAPDGYALPLDREQDVVVSEAGSTGKLTFSDRKLWNAPTIDKSVIGNYDASFAWSIDKTVRTTADGDGSASAESNIVEGEDTTYFYDVTVTQGAITKSNYRASGEIEVTNTNGAPMRATLVDSLPNGTCVFPDGTDVDPVADGVQVDLAAGVNAFTYSCTGGQTADDNNTNTASVSWSRTTYPQTQSDVDAPNPGNGTAEIEKDFTFDIGTATNASITVTDDKHQFDPAWTINWSGEGVTETKSYSTTTEGTVGECTTVTNTATIVETEQSASTNAKTCVERDLATFRPVVKSQFELDPATDTWVPSDGAVTFGDQVRYELSIEADPTKKAFQDTVVSDYVPGYNPDDSTSNGKASYVAGSAKCSGDVTCEIAIDPVTKRVTWKLTSKDPGAVNGEVYGGDKGTVEFTVTMDEPIDPVFTNGVFEGTMWNKGYLDWNETVQTEEQPVEVRRLAAIAKVPHSLVTNEVIEKAQLTEPSAVDECDAANPPASCDGDASPADDDNDLPDTGGPNRWLASGGLALLAAGALLVLGSRRRESRS